MQMQNFVGLQKTGFAFKGVVCALQNDSKNNNNNTIYNEKPNG